jgi:hypothetical protein
MTKMTQDALENLLKEVSDLCELICNSSPDTTIKGEIESKAFMLGHHPAILNPTSVLIENENS